MSPRLRLDISKQLNYSTTSVVVVNIIIAEYFMYRNWYFIIYPVAYMTQCHQNLKYMLKSSVSRTTILSIICSIMALCCFLVPLEYKYLKSSN